MTEIERELVISLRFSLPLTDEDFELRRSELQKVADTFLLLAEFLKMRFDGEEDDVRVGGADEFFETAIIFVSSVKLADETQIFLTIEAAKAEVRKVFTLSPFLVGLDFSVA
jgi:hypothetical protein